MNKRDYYEVLGVQKNATDSEIKKQYRKLSKQYHPDTQIGKTDEEKLIAENAFKEISEAYDILSDKDKRQRYDQFGHSLGSNQMHYDDVNLEDIINSFKEHVWGRQKSPNGAPMKLSINLTLKEIFNGAVKKIKYKTNHVCSHCNGEKYVPAEGGVKEVCSQCKGKGILGVRQGPMLFSQTCTTCNGSGYIIKNGCKVCNSTGFTKFEEYLEITVPKGIPDNSYITFTGKGNEYLINNSRVIGDLIVFFNQIPDSTFIRNGNDLHQEVRVSIYDCLLGSEIMVNTIDDKKYKLKLKVGTNSEQQFRLTGLGMPILNNNNKGDMYIHIHHIIPTEITQEQIELLTKLKSTINEQ